ncbi:MAG: YcgL domain-containing protein [Gammaproteobacteria bacterium]|nr:YcgL domain-containing protein [Gammaproteobacteria bacterium]
MKCAIYKSLKKPDTYLYIERENDFSRIPEGLLQLLGRLELVMNLDLTPGRKLAQADADEVRRQLDVQGYYLQMPAKELAPQVMH